MKKRNAKDDASRMLNEILAFAAESAKSNNAKDGDDSFGIMISFSPREVKMNGCNESTIKVGSLNMPR